MPSVMDFFEHQEQARKRTGRLVVLYALAVGAIIVCVYLVIATVVQWQAMKHGEAAGFWHPELLVAVGGGVILVVGLASLFKISELGAGGDVVAKAVGGRLINTGTRDDVERKVLNVVEEMAIASGTPVPSVYMLDRESRINAFAAGYRPEQAVIGVTRGCAELLSRDELQGVIAHEFSHVLNGDMRLNIRLIGVLHGILVIGLLGTYLMRVSMYSGRSSRRDNSGAALIAVGAALAVLGYLGTFFGGLIKAAVSRQREYLADASAVSFTRQPEGIAGALRKIGGSLGKARLSSPKAAQFSHMYFGQGVTTYLNAMATHPPLDDRIKRIDPRWDGRYPDVTGLARTAEPRAEREWKPERAKLRQAVPTEAILGAVAAVGRPTAEHVDYAAQLVAGLPDVLKEAVHETAGARAATFALLLSDDAEVRARQVAHLGGEAARAEALVGAVREAGPEARLPLLDLAVPALKAMPRAEYDGFKRAFVALAGADETIDRFEWLLRRMILLYLEPHFERVPAPVVQFYNLAGVRAECARLLSTLAHAGHADPAGARSAFDAGARGLGVADMDLLPADQCGLRALDEALDRIATVTPRLKKRVLEACAACIAADRQVTVEEGEFFRGIADVLDCPMPPLLPGQKL